MSDGKGILAIDVGSSRVKLGWFPPPGECDSVSQGGPLPVVASRLPTPSETLTVSHADQAALWAKIAAWLSEHCPSAPPGFVASVHPNSTPLVQEMFGGRLRAIAVDDLPLEVRVEEPERVGIDRLLNAVAVNRLRQEGRPAIVVDLGTACTVDLIATDGAFEGGAILPGPTVAASALHFGTATLPQLELDFGEAPAVVGKSTVAAISAGLYWGMLGAITELVGRMSRDDEPTPQVFFTGGCAPPLVAPLSEHIESLRHIPNLVLSGIAIVAEELS